MGAITEDTSGNGGGDFCRLMKVVGAESVGHTCLASQSGEEDLVLSPELSILLSPQSPESSEKRSHGIGKRRAGNTSLCLGPHQPKGGVREPLL